MKPIFHLQYHVKMIDHYIDVMMTTVASQITSLTVVYSIVYSGAGQRKHQSPASLAFVRGIHRAGEFPAQRASNAENVSIWWRHHASWYQFGQRCTRKPPDREHIVAASLQTVIITNSLLVYHVQLTICHHWFGCTFDAGEATRHYLNQWWPRSMIHDAIWCH